MANNGHVYKLIKIEFRGGGLKCAIIGDHLIAKYEVVGSPHCLM